MVSQTYCYSWGGHKGRIALDFKMPMGAEIIAAREGRVIEIKTKFKDGDDQPGHNNRVLIRHEDRSIAWYAHLQHESIVVEVGDTVEQGQPIGGCGNTGRTGGLPHLHFEVFKRTPYQYSDAIPVSFRNARSPLDERGGLVSGEYYAAMPDSLLK